MNERQSKEWLFEFGLYSQDGLAEIPEAACRELMDLVIEWAEAKKITHRRRVSAWQRRINELIIKKDCSPHTRLG